MVHRHEEIKLCRCVRRNDKCVTWAHNLPIYVDERFLLQRMWIGYGGGEDELHGDVNLEIKDLAKSSCRDAPLMT